MTIHWGSDISETRNVNGHGFSIIANCCACITFTWFLTNFNEIIESKHWSNPLVQKPFLLHPFNHLLVKRYVSSCFVPLEACFVSFMMWRTSSDTQTYSCIIFVFFISSFHSSLYLDLYGFSDRRWLIFCGGLPCFACNVW